MHQRQVCTEKHKIMCEDWSWYIMMTHRVLNVVLKEIHWYGLLLLGVSKQESRQERPGFQCQQQRWFIRHKSLVENKGYINAFGWLFDGYWITHRSSGFLKFLPVFSIDDHLYHEHAFVNKAQHFNRKNMSWGIYQGLDSWEILEHTSWSSQHKLALYAMSIWN
jgi:hypothetical protein